MGERDLATGHAFISYVRENASSVNLLETRLRDSGIPVWRDVHDLWPGQDWAEEIRRAISKDSLAFIACFSLSSASRPISFQNEELILAIEQLRRRDPNVPWLIPVRLDDCQIPDLDIGGGRTLRSIQRVDFFGDRRDEEARRLVMTVQRILGNDPGPGAAPRPVPSGERRLSPAGCVGNSLQSADSLLSIEDRWRDPSPGTAPPTAPKVPGGIRRRWQGAWPPSPFMSALVLALLGCLMGAWYGSVGAASSTMRAAAVPNGCRDMRTVDDGGARDQDIGPTLVIEGQTVTACQHFLDRLDPDFRSIFARVQAQDEQIVRSGHNYKIAYFVGPLSNTQGTVSLPPSPLLQLLGAERVMERYTGDDHLRHGLARTLTGTNWYLVLIPVNTGFLGLHGVEAVHLIGPQLHETRTAGVLGLSVSTSHSLATAGALAGIPVFTTAVTGEFMRSASNLWLSQTMNDDNASVLVDAALRNGGSRPVTVITDGSDGASVAPIRSSSPCPSAHTPIRERYSIELTRDLVSWINARHVEVSCLDYRALEPLTQAGPFRCAGLRSGTLISALRGWALGQFMDVLNNCPGWFTIVSAEGATNLTEAGQNTLRDVWRRGRSSLTYLGYQSTGSHHQERGEQAQATGADSASALWAAAGAAQSLTTDPQHPGPWSAGDIMRALARQSLSVPAMHLDDGSGRLDPPLDRSAFTFAAGSRQASSPDGGIRPVALCTVIDVNLSGIFDHCQPPA